jgi:glycosyltransferase involved in cell wall biosynthesis
VEFLAGPSDAELLELYRTAVATVLPSVYLDHLGRFQRAPELMGLTLIESMACGTPAVCPRVGGMPELVRDGETGFVYDSPAGLTDVLTRLRDDPALVEAVGRRAREAAVAEYDVAVVGRRVAALYQAALAPGSGRGPAA